MGKVKSINCTQCGNALDLFGGHNVETIICPACKSCLDGKDEYKVISQFLSATKKMPKLPLKIGMKGIIKDIEFTIIGYIRYKEDFEKYYDFQLYSPTHGYAWLTRNDYNYIFSREVKDLPDVDNPMSQLYEGQKFTARDITFNVFEKGYEEIDYVAGELTWRGQKGDSSSYVTGVKPPYSYTITEENNELSFSFGEYIETEKIYEIFGVKDDVPANSATPSPLLNSAIIQFFGFAIISFALVIYFTVTGGGTKVFSEGINCRSLPTKINKKINISTPNKLVLLNLKCSFDNAWGYFDVRITRDGKEYLNFAKNLSYYSGYEGGERWSEGSQSVDVYVRLPEAGEYELDVAGEGGYGNYGKGFSNKKLYISVYENVILTRYFIIATILLGIIGGICFTIQEGRK